MSGDGFEPGLHLSGKGGVLLRGWDVVTELNYWTAQIGASLSNGKRGLRITVGGHTPDPYLFEHREEDDEYTLELQIAPRRGKPTEPVEAHARIANGAPLIIEAWKDDDA